MFDGWTAARGVDPQSLPYDRFCNLIYYWLTRGDQDRRARVDLELSAGDVEAPGWSAEEEMALFRAAQSASAR